MKTALFLLTFLASVICHAQENRFVVLHGDSQIEVVLEKGFHFKTADQADRLRGIIHDVAEKHCGEALCSGSMRIRFQSDLQKEVKEQMHFSIQRVVITANPLRQKKSGDQKAVSASWM